MAGIADRNDRSTHAVESATLEWVDKFNDRRLFESIGNIPPAEYEKMYYTEQERPVVGVGLK